MENYEYQSYDFGSLPFFILGGTSYELLKSAITYQLSKH